MKKPALVLSVLLLAGCTSDDAVSLKNFARSGVFPPTLSSYDSAMEYVRYLQVRGRVDRVRIGMSSFIVVFQHGSGIPVVKIAVYRRTLWSWKFVAEPRPKISPDASLVSEFLRATVSDGKIMVVGERSNRSWLLYDPNENSG